MFPHYLLTIYFFLGFFWELFPFFDIFVGLLREPKVLKIGADFFQSKVQVLSFFFSGGGVAGSAYFSFDSSSSLELTNSSFDKPSSSSFELGSEVGFFFFFLVLLRREGLELVVLGVSDSFLVIFNVAGTKAASSLIFETSMTGS